MSSGHWPSWVGVGGINGDVRPRVSILGHTTTLCGTAHRDTSAAAAVAIITSGERGGGLQSGAERPFGVHPLGQKAQRTGLKPEDNGQGQRAWLGAWPRPGKEYVDGTRLRRGRLGLTGTPPAGTLPSECFRTKLARPIDQQIDLVRDGTEWPRPIGGKSLNSIRDQFTGCLLLLLSFPETHCTARVVLPTARRTFSAFFSPNPDPFRIIPGNYPGRRDWRKAAR